MYALRELQIRCRDAFLYGSDGVLADDLEVGGLAPPLQIRIYQNNVRENFRKALASTYAVIHELVGPDCFAALARDYARCHPSRSGDLERFGAHFPDFLDKHFCAGDARGDGGGEFAYLGDVARLERRLDAARFAADAVPADLSVLRGLEECALPALRFTLHPSVAVCASPYPIYSIWHAHQVSGATVDLRSGSEFVLIWRTGPSVRAEPVDAAMGAFVAALTEREPLGVAMHRAANHAASFDVGAALMRLAGNALIAEVITAT